MTRDDIIRMAREAGGSRENPSDLLTFGILERFAGLVAAAEREECAKVCEELERKKWEVITTGGVLSGFGAIDCATAIRATNKGD